LLSTISITLWENVLQRYRFSTQGAAQLNADLAAICRVVDKQGGDGMAEAGLRKCIEGVRIVGLPVKSRGANTRAMSSEGGDEGEEWDEGAWGDGDEAQKKVNTGDVEEDETKELGLWEVERRLFADNQSARDVLEELGLELLSETEARALLRRRVELAG
jgi:hypothetical protein